MEPTQEVNPRSARGVKTGRILAAIAGALLAFAAILANIKLETDCRSRFAANSVDLRTCLGQNGQGPGWLIGCGWWTVIVAYYVGYAIGKVGDRRNWATFDEEEE